MNFQIKIRKTVRKSSNFGLEKKKNIHNLKIESYVLFSENF